MDLGISPGRDARLLSGTQQTCPDRPGALQTLRRRQNSSAMTRLK